MQRKENADTAAKKKPDNKAELIETLLTISIISKLMARRLLSGKAEGDRNEQDE